MAEIDELKDQLAALRKLRVSGVKRTLHERTESELKPDAEMAAAEADLLRRIAALETDKKRRRRAFTAG